MKKVFNIAFSLILILSIFSCSRLKSYYKNDELVATTSETDNVVNNFGDKLIQLEGDVATLSKYPLPKVGSKIYGFNIDAIYDYKYQNAKLVSMTHEKSGARAILISNDDIDKSAVFGFNIVISRLLRLSLFSAIIFDTMSLLYFTFFIWAISNTESTKSLNL